LKSSDSVEVERYFSESLYSLPDFFIPAKEDVHPWSSGVLGTSWPPWMFTWKCWGCWVNTQSFVVHSSDLLNWLRLHISMFSGLRWCVKKCLADNKVLRINPGKSPVCDKPGAFRNPELGCYIYAVTPGRKVWGPAEPTAEMGRT